MPIEHRHHCRKNHAYPPPPPPWLNEENKGAQESDHEAAAVIAAELGTILYSEEVKPLSPGKVQEGLEEIKLKVLRDITEEDEARTVLGITESFPDVKYEKIRQAVMLILANYWPLNCWICRDKGH